MTTFLLDIWHDLREKRLWPVAVALLAATVAIPMVMIKPAQTPQLDTAPPAGNSEPLPTVSLDQGIIDSSYLDAFDVRDPFNSQADSPGASSVPGAGEGGRSGDGGGDAGTASGSGSSSGGDGGGVAGGSGGSAPNGSGGSGGSGGTKYFTYTVDVRFGKRGKPETFKSVETLDLLPNDQNPIVSFMGMSDNAKTAVFFIVDPSFEADGEGDCAPSEADCRFVYLGVDDDRDEETLSAAEGNVEYTLQLDRITIKRLSANDAVGDAQPDKGTDTTTPSARRQERDTFLTAPLASLR